MNPVQYHTQRNAALRRLRRQIAGVGVLILVLVVWLAYLIAPTFHFSQSEGNDGPLLMLSPYSVQPIPLVVQNYVEEKTIVEEEAEAITQEVVSEKAAQPSNNTIDVVEEANPLLLMEDRYFPYRTPLPDVPQNSLPESEWGKCIRHERVLEVAGLFTDGMVVQRNARWRVWGWLVAPPAKQNVDPFRAEGEEGEELRGSSLYCIRVGLIREGKVVARQVVGVPLNVESWLIEMPEQDADKTSNPIGGVLVVSAVWAKVGERKYDDQPTSAKVENWNDEEGVLSPLRPQKVIRDLRFGDVFVCSGQSNMDYDLEQVGREMRAIGSQLNAPLHPNVRIFSVQPVLSYMMDAGFPWHDAHAPRTGRKRNVNVRELDTDLWEHGGWVDASSLEAIFHTSYLCLETGMRLLRTNATQNTKAGNGAAAPDFIGLLEAAWGGTHVQGWLPRDATEPTVRSPEGQAQVGIEVSVREKRGPAPATTASQGKGISPIEWADDGVLLGLSMCDDVPQQCRSVKGSCDKAARPTTRTAEYWLLHTNDPTAVGWNAQIHPLLQYPVSAVLWWQGEQNVNEPTVFTCRTRQLIHTYRSLWFRGGLGPLPFVSVQLAGCGHPVANGWYPHARDAQRRAVEASGPFTALVTAYDCGSSNSLHSFTQQCMADRLAAAVKKLVYKDQEAYRVPRVIGYKWGWDADEQHKLCAAVRGASPTGGTLSLRLELFLSQSVHSRPTVSCDVCCSGNASGLFEYSVLEGLLHDNVTWHQATFGLRDAKSAQIHSMQNLPGDVIVLNMSSIPWSVFSPSGGAVDSVLQRQHRFARSEEMMNNVTSFTSDKGIGLRYAFADFIQCAFRGHVNVGGFPMLPFQNAVRLPNVCPNKK